MPRPLAALLLALAACSSPGDGERTDDLPSTPEPDAAPPGLDPDAAPPPIDACVPSTWYLDCDGDGLAASEDGAVEACARPDDPPDACSNLALARWTSRSPANLLLTDCDDDDDATLTADTWYVDCDGDGFAATSAGSTTACQAPAPAPACDSSAATWTTERPVVAADPADATVDCADHEVDAFPGQVAWFSAPIAGAAEGAAFDYDCDGAVERRYGGVYACSVEPFGEGWLCSSSPGYAGGTPACGAEGSYRSGCTLSGPSLACGPASTAPQRQVCR